MSDLSSECLVSVESRALYGLCDGGYESGVLSSELRFMCCGFLERWGAAWMLLRTIAAKLQQRDVYSARSSSTLANDA
ncbi:hypothetical protein M758_6G016500 [Ceratodon purpureus]|uniref:Uncharacterized protein n=1 Tax=Ceratodon purpureus TaxID=3225 RepID=A0A8T0HAX4_CERPU|nr:hypothetical protein KC19_6G019000 [Ceratodon purpureus]KAG0612299.1 hypothetical protein M758_6G016500 [Ceratodon purpureus]